MNLRIVIVLAIIAVIVGTVVFNQQIRIQLPREDKSIEEIVKPATETKVINETRAKEIDKVIDEIKLNNITVFGQDEDNIKTQLTSSEYAQVVIWVKDKEKIDEVISTFNQKELKVQAIFKKYSPYTINGNITLVGLEKLKNNPNVEKITVEHRFSGSLKSSIPLINADSVWFLKINNINITGLNITVCVVDSGINYTHADFGGCPATDNINTANCSKVIGGIDTVGLADDNNPMDDNGHGTHVSGIIMADGNIKGAAPHSNITAVKVLNQNGIAEFEADIREGIEWCIDNRNKYNIKIMSLSLGSNVLYNSSCDGVDQVVNAANNAKSYGILAVASSGNNASTSGMTSPACGSNVTSVSATTKSDVIDTSYANRNNITDLVAPGTIINSTGQPYNPDCTAGNNYQVCSGTSMSAPHVSGTVALMLQANNSLTPSEIENLLKKTGRPVYDPVTKLTFPRVDALKAVLSSYNPLVVTDFRVLNQDGFNATFEFKIFNSLNATVNDVYWTVVTGDGSVTLTNRNTQNITLNPYNETFVYVQYQYSTSGSFSPIVYANASSLSSNTQNTPVSIIANNLRLTNFTILNTSGTERTFEFFIENNGTVNTNNIYWNMTVTGEGGVNGTIGINLKTNEVARVYVNYNYTTGGLHNIIARVDPANSIVETNETDNEQTIDNN